MIEQSKSCIEGSSSEIERGSDGFCQYTNGHLIVRISNFTNKAKLRLRIETVVNLRALSRVGQVSDRDNLRSAELSKFIER